MTTPSSRLIPGKFKIEVTKDPIYHVGKNGEHLTKDPVHHVGKNGEHFYGENFIYDHPSKRHTKSNPHICILHAFSKSNPHMGILHAFSYCIRETFNHWSLSLCVAVSVVIPFFSLCWLLFPVVLMLYFFVVMLLMVVAMAMEEQTKVSPQNHDGTNTEIEKSNGRDVKKKQPCGLLVCL